MAIIYATWLDCKWNMKDRKGEGVANSAMLVLQYYFMVLNHHVLLLFCYFFTCTGLNVICIRLVQYVTSHKKNCMLKMS